MPRLALIRSNSCTLPRRHRKRLNFESSTSSTVERHPGLGIFSALSSDAVGSEKPCEISLCNLQAIGYSSFYYIKDQLDRALPSRLYHSKSKILQVTREELAKPNRLVHTSQELLHKPGINNANAATIKARDDDKALVDKYLPTKWTL
ncbi:hypothetical protein NC652_006746 [Populus alba x Populus x berolinensis]|nr:hypothetical protein NC652_006746 [Populus alba x Populus x berolinensis]